MIEAIVIVLVYYLFFAQRKDTVKIFHLYDEISKKYAILCSKCKVDFTGDQIVEVIVRKDDTSSGFAQCENCRTIVRFG